MGLAVKLKLAVPTDLPCCEMMKLADWAGAAGADAISAAKRAASGKMVSLRMNLSIYLV